MKLFDLKYKERMKKHSSPVDTEQLWKDIQKKKRTKRGFIFWWTGIGLLIITAGLYYFLNPTFKNGRNSEGLLHTQPVIADRKSDSDSNKMLSIKNDKDALFQSKQASVDPNFYRENANEQKHKSSRKLKPLNQIKSNTMEIQPTVFHESSDLTESANTYFKPNSVNELQSLEPEKADPQAMNGVNLYGNEHLEEVLALPVLLKQLIIHSKLLVDHLNTIPNPAVRLKPQTMEKPWFLQMGFGQSLVDRRFNANSDSFPTRNTKVLYAFNSEINLSRALSKQFEIFTGIRYTHILSQNKGSFRSSEELVKPKGQIIEHISLEGISSFSEEDIHLRRVTTIYNTSYQRMYLMDWSLGVNYSKPINSWAIFVNAATACNVFSKASGNYLTKENGYTDIQKEIKTHLGFSISGGVGLSYLLKNRSAISFSINYCNYLNSFNRNPRIQEHYKLIGGQLSYKFKL
ncbi:MAG: acyloxyacyl hydrolase [Saprospiraceae bacterium]